MSCLEGGDKILLSQLTGESVKFQLLPKKVKQSVRKEFWKEKKYNCKTHWILNQLCFKTATPTVVKKPLETNTVYSYILARPF